VVATFATGLSTPTGAAPASDGEPASAEPELMGAATVVERPLAGGELLPLAGGELLPLGSRQAPSASTPANSTLEGAKKVAVERVTAPVYTPHPVRAKKCAGASANSSAPRRLTVD